ncbi:hypothetical protein lerEdw1_004656 [Lerista edwardsae]|nr:hypothetical protein lerEdw1_004656 [Lerista edwardsae]
MAASRPFSESSLLVLLFLLLFLQILGARGQDLEVRQPPGPLLLSAGETLTLNCTLMGLSVPGGVRWYKGTDRSQPAIYSERAPQGNPRVTRIVSGGEEDFSIRISDIRPEDAGTYYCVKLRAGNPEREYKSGTGTVVSVIVPSNVRMAKEPASPAQPGDSVMLTCFVEGGFDPRDRSLVWLVNGKETHLEPSVSMTQNPEGTFSLKSSVEVAAAKRRKPSVFTCQVTHNSQPIYNLSISTRLMALDPPEGSGAASPDTGAAQAEVLQSPDFVTASVGENLTLNCTLNGVGLRPGGIRWYKGSWNLVYKDAGTGHRARRAVPDSSTDFSILIPNLKLRDAGTYYCLKSWRVWLKKRKKWGGGTVVSVIARPSRPSILGPPGRVESGAAASFHCRSGGFFPRNVTVAWFKDGRRVSGAPEPVLLPQAEDGSYAVRSQLDLLLSEEDVNSQLVCQISHSSMQEPLNQTLGLGSALRVPPKLWLEMDPASPITLDDSVTITCIVEGFYPNDTSLVWLENWEEIGLDVPVLLTQNLNGTFSLESSLAVTAMEPRNRSVFSCMVKNHFQPLFSKSTILNITTCSWETGRPTSQKCRVQGGAREVCRPRRVLPCG